MIKNLEKIITLAIRKTLKIDNTQTKDKRDLQNSLQPTRVYLKGVRRYSPYVAVRTPMTQTTRHERTKTGGVGESAGRSDSEGATERTSQRGRGVRTGGQDFLRGRSQGGGLVLEAGHRASHLRGAALPPHWPVIRVARSLGPACETHTRFDQRLWRVVFVNIRVGR